MYHREADKLGDHRFSCAMGYKHIMWHNHVRQVLYETARQANLAPIPEMVGLLPHSKDRPVDIHLPHFINWRPPWWHVQMMGSMQCRRHTRGSW